MWMLCAFGGLNCARFEEACGTAVDALVPSVPDPGGKPPTTINVCAEIQRLAARQLEPVPIFFVC